MKVTLFGASGMVGQGVLRACLQDEGVERVQSIVRRASGLRHDKLQEIIHSDFYDFSAIAPLMAGRDGCFFCLGVSSAGMSEADYHRVTHDITLAAAAALLAHNSALTFVFVSGAGTDSTERGRSMWARVKGKTENALLKLPFKAAYMFRPGLIQPLDGIQSKTALYRRLYRLGAPLFALLKWLSPSSITTTQAVGQAMINAVRHGAPRRHLSNADINQLSVMK